MDLMDHFARGPADHCGSFLLKYLAFVVTDYFLSSLNYLQISPNSYCRMQVQRKVFSCVGVIKVLVTEGGSHFAADALIVWLIGREHTNVQ